jgi:hypothetical protein
MLPLEIIAAYFYKEQAGDELCQAHVKLGRAKVAVARKKLRAYLL